MTMQSRYVTQREFTDVIAERCTLSMIAYPVRQVLYGHDSEHYYDPYGREVAWSVRGLDGSVRHYVNPAE
jgi:hypothetical protein